MSKKAYLNEPVPTITITPSDIRDYQACSLYYHFKTTEPVTKIGINELNQERFSNSMKKVISYFFYKRQGEATPSYNSLLKRWEKIWFPDKMDSYDLIHEQHNIVGKNTATYSNTAAGLLLRFFNDFAKKDKGIPINIDQEHLIPLIDGVRLSGNTDLILKYGADSYRIIKWESAIKKKIKTFYRYDFATMKLAHMHSTGRADSSEVSYELYGVGSDSDFGPVNHSPTKRDIDWLFYWAHKIKEQEIRVPSKGFTTYCSGCQWDRKCDAWNG